MWIQGTTCQLHGPAASHTRTQISWMQHRSGDGDQGIDGGSLLAPSRARLPSPRYGAGLGNPALGVTAAGGKQFLVRAAFGHTAFGRDIDSVGDHRCGETVGDHDGGSGGREPA